MDRDSRSPENESNEHAGSSDSCSIRPNPFKDNGDSSRKRRRTSLNMDNSRSRSVESADPDQMANDSAAKSADPVDPVDPGTPHTDDHTADGVAKHTQDTAEPAAEPAAKAPAVARPQTPAQTHEPVPAGTPSNVALRPRNSGRQLTSDDDVSPQGGVPLLLTPPAQPPRSRSQDDLPPSYQETEEVAGISVAAEAAASAPVLAGQSPAGSTSDDDDIGVSPPVEIVDVPDSDDEISLLPEDTITLLSRNGSANGHTHYSPLEDPTPGFPYYIIHDSIFDHIIRLSGFLLAEENLAREVQLWIDRYLDFAQNSTLSTVRQSFYAYHQLWIALPTLITNNPQLRAPNYGLPPNSPRRRSVSLLCRSFARLTAHFVEFDTKVTGQHGLVSLPYITALLTLATERPLQAEVDRLELGYEDDNCARTLFAFLDHNRTPPNGMLTLLMRHLEAQSLVLPMSAQAVENFFTICSLVAVLIREIYHKSLYTAQTGSLGYVPGDCLALGQRALETGRRVFETAITDHIEYLSSDQTSLLIASLGELYYIDLCVNPDKAADLASALTDVCSEIQPSQLSDALVMDWKIATFFRLVKNSQMTLRLMAVESLSSDLISFWRRYNDQGPTLPVVRYVASTLHSSDVVAYFLSPACHPQVTARSFNVIGFLAISRTYTAADTDLFWRYALTAQDPSNIFKVMKDVVPYFSHDTAIYFCQRFLTVPVSAFANVHMRSLFEAVYRYLTEPTSPRPKSLDAFLPFKVCLRLIRELSSPADDGSTRYPDVQRFFVEKMDDVLKNVGSIEDHTQRYGLYRACLADLDPTSPAVLGSLSAILIINRFCSDGVGDIGYLIREHDLVQLLVDNLEHVINSMPPAARVPVLHGEVNAPRRDMLFLVLAIHSPALTHELSVRLWNLMFGTAAACEADRDASWSIITSICSDKLDQRNNPFLLLCLSRYIGSLPTSCFCQGMLKFLEEWLVPVLNEPGCDLLAVAARLEAEDLPRDTTDGAPESDVSSTALEQLWHIVLTTPAGTIENGATQLLAKKVYINSQAIRCSTPEDMRMIYMALIKRCLRQISSAAKTLESLSKDPTQAAGDSDVSLDKKKSADVHKQELLFLRSVRFLQQFLRQYREAFPRQSSQGRRVFRQGVSAGIKYQSFDGTKNTAVKPLDIGRQNTAGHLLARLEAATGFEQCKIYAHGRLFAPKDISESLEDLKLCDCILLVKRDVAAGADSLSPIIKYADMEDAILDRFQELWESLGLSKDLASEVYELLVHLAVGDNMFQLFERENLSYKDVLYANQPYKSLYALHALHEFLMTRKIAEEVAQSAADNDTRAASAMDLQEDTDTAATTDAAAGKLSPELADKVATSDSSADTRMDTPDGSTGSKSSSTNAIDTPQSKSNDMDVEDEDGHADESLYTPRAGSPYASALAMSASLVTGAVCNPSITAVTEAKAGLQTDLHYKLLQILELVLTGAVENKAVLEKLDANLLSHLVDMLVAALEDPQTEPTMGLIELLFRTITDACALSRSFWAAFQEHPQTKSLIGHLLLADDRPAVRELGETQIGKRAVFGGEVTGADVVSLADFQEFFLPIIIELVPKAIHEPMKCDGIFNLIEGCFRRPLSTGVPLQVDALLLATANLVLDYDTFEDATRPDVGDCAMRGLTAMLDSVYRAAQGAGKLPPDFAHKLFWKHLFPPWPTNKPTSTSSSSDIHIVQSTDTRRLLTSLITDIGDNDPKQLRKLVKNLDQLVPSDLREDEDGISLYQYELPQTFDRRRALRASCGYVGLRNLSNTCYFNSLLTQLFMNVEFRRFMIHVDPDNDDAESLVFQTRVLFSNMQNSVRRFLDTQACTYTIKTYDDGPIDISVQMDVDEFYNLLFDRWEGQMSTPTDKRKLRSFYGGQIVQQIRSHQCEHVSERLEPFSAIQCDIKGKSNLMESLEAYVEGEVMEGENKYKCSDCNEHVVATKRACLKDMPDHLIFHLKRFEFNLRNGTRNKINDYFSFPDEIDMRPYTIDQLSDPDSEQTPDVFELVGVLVHAGTAESGHYYSFIRERPSSKPQGSWVEFNDDAVSEWDPALMNAQCFGGLDQRQKYDGGENIEKSYSAYMLFYQRRSAVSREQEALVQCGQTSPRKVPLLPEAAQYIHNENLQLLRRHVLFDPQHLPFVGKALSLVPFVQPDGQCSGNHQLEDRALQMALSHLDQVAARRTGVPGFKTLLDNVMGMCNRCDLCSLAVLDYFVARPLVFQQMAQRCLDADVRMDTCRLVIEVLMNVKAKFPRSYFSLPQIHFDDRGVLVVNHSPDGDLYMDGLDDADDADDVDDAGVVSAQRNPRELLQKCTIVLGMQGLVKTLWDHVHGLLRSWPETFYFMQLFVSLGRAEVAAFMDVGGFHRALEVIMADAALPEMSAQMMRMVQNIERRRIARPVSYDSLIAVVGIVMTNMYVDTKDTKETEKAGAKRQAGQLYVENDVSRLAMLLQRSDADLPMSWMEFQMITQDWPEQSGAQAVNVFVDKLVGLDQNAEDTDAILLRLMARHEEMKKMVFVTLKAGFSAHSNKHHTPYVRAAMTYIRNVEPTDKTALMLTLYLAEQCRVLTSSINRRVYFEALQGLFYDAGRRQSSLTVMDADADADTNTDADADATRAAPAFDLGLLEEKLHMVTVWAPGLLAYYEPVVNVQVLEFLQDNLFAYGPEPVFSESEGGAARAQLTKAMVRQFGIGLLSFLKDSFVNRHMRAHSRIVASVERLVALMEPFFAEAAASTDEDDIADALQFRQLLPVVAVLSGATAAATDIGDIGDFDEDEYESGADEEGDWNDDSSEVEEDSAGNISTNTAGEPDADVP